MIARARADSATPWLAHRAPRRPLLRRTRRPGRAPALPRLFDATAEDERSSAGLPHSPALRPTRPALVRRALRHRTLEPLRHGRAGRAAPAQRDPQEALE